MKTLQTRIGSVLQHYGVWMCAVFAMLTAVYPCIRAFFRIEVNYNEGWSVYNTNTVANHHLLYPVKYGWTTVNYPMLSFFLMAQLHRLTNNYLFTARAVSLLSLLGCCLLVGAIVRRLGGSWRAPILAGFFCLALFCTDATLYVGMDDPQMLAQVFFLAGLLIYVWRRESTLAITCAALLFVVGGCIKHNLIDFPLAVLIDLVLSSRRRALWFSACGLVFAGLAVALNIRYGGPQFLSQVLSPRGYLASKISMQLLVVFGPILLPFAVVLYAAWMLRHDEKKRIASILLATSLVVGGYFGGGIGVAINTLFSALLATSILVGLFFDDVPPMRWNWTRNPESAFAPLLLFAWLVVPLIVWDNWNPMQNLRETASEQRRFDEDVAFLRDRQGPALCESLLRCYFAGKPYLYDPFNATMSIRGGKLDPAVIVDAVRSQRYAAIQFDGPIQGLNGDERFNIDILTAIQQNYAPALQHQDAVIYIPKPVVATTPANLDRNSLAAAVIPIRRPHGRS